MPNAAVRTDPRNSQSSPAAAVPLLATPLCAPHLGDRPAVVVEQQPLGDVEEDGGLAQWPGHLAMRMS